MMTPALAAIRHTFPGAEIVVAANPLVAQLFSPHPCCDRVLVYDRKGDHSGAAGFLRFVRKLRSERFDLAILLQKAFEAALLTFLAGIPRRIGFSTDGRRLLLTGSVPLTDKVRSQHHSRHYLEMLKAFGITGGSGELQLVITPAEREHALKRLGEGCWLGVNPGAAYGSAKRWYPERFAQVADTLAEEFGFQVVVIGGPGEKAIGQDIVQQMRHQALNLVGETSVREMMAVIAHCSLIISNDSGPMHVAAALQVPTVAIFGPTDHTTTYPWTARYRVAYQNVECAPCLKRVCPTDHRCMILVTSEMVVSAAREILK
ncbi:ADP-heptose--LPS heptosyltransferase [Desulfuromonas sp. AOP6]|nr:ADP-heptose--LPS heptosyltransferase [Desulfuromonas sp. AOP6]